MSCKDAELRLKTVALKLRIGLKLFGYVSYIALPIAKFSRYVKNSLDMMNLFDHEHINYNIDLSMLEHYRFCRHLTINLISHILGLYTSLDIGPGY